jgi:hypothetical protein
VDQLCSALTGGRIGSAGGGVGPNMAVTRVELEGVVEPLLRRLWEPLERLAAATHTEYVSR